MSFRRFDAGRVEAKHGYTPAVALREGLAEYVNFVAHAEEVRDARSAHF